MAHASRDKKSLKDLQIDQESIDIIASKLPKVELTPEEVANIVTKVTEELKKEVKT